MKFQLNKRIEVLKEEIINDDFGGRTKAWNVYKPIWCNIKHTDLLRKNEEETKQELYLDVISVIIRFNNYISEKNRLRFKKKEYEIKKIIEFDNNLLKIIAEEVSLSEY